VQCSEMSSYPEIAEAESSLGVTCCS
jgi:hypothetical protein